MVTIGYNPFSISSSKLSSDRSLPGVESSNLIPLVCRPRFLAGQIALRETSNYLPPHSLLLEYQQLPKSPLKPPPLLHPDPLIGHSSPWPSYPAQCFLQCFFSPALDLPPDLLVYPLGDLQKVKVRRKGGRELDEQVVEVLERAYTGER